MPPTLAKSALLIDCRCVGSLGERIRPDDRMAEGVRGAHPGGRTAAIAADSDKRHRHPVAELRPRNFNADSRPCVSHRATNPVPPVSFPHRALSVARPSLKDKDPRLRAQAGDWPNVRGFDMASVCSIAGCGKPQRSRGWCAMHYTRWFRHGDPLDKAPGKSVA